MERNTEKGREMLLHSFSERDEALLSEPTNRQTDGGGAWIAPWERGRLRFGEAIRLAEEQVDMAELLETEAKEAPIVHDMCRAIAEVYMLASRAPSAQIVISGEALPAEMVAEILSQVTYGIAVDVATEVDMSRVTCPKAYLRSYLYHRVIEYETACMKT